MPREPVKSNTCELSGVAFFSISIVPGLMRFRTVQLAYWLGPTVTSPTGVVSVKPLRRTRLPLLVILVTLH